MSRRMLWILGWGLALCAVSGCTPAVQGQAGVQLDSDGRLNAVIGWCAGPGDTQRLTLYVVDRDRRVGQPIVDLVHTGPPLHQRLTQVPLAGPPPNWHNMSPPLPIEPAQAYELRAWNTNGDRVWSIDFQPSQLPDSRSTHPILTQIGKPNHKTNQFVNTTQFQAATTSWCS